MEARLTLRPRADGDTRFIRALGHEAFGEYDGNAGEYSVAASGRAATFIAERAGARVGFVVLEHASGGSVHLAAIAVTESARGVGVGAALVAAAERHAKAMGASTIDLTTADSNVAALSLFRRAGFRQRSGAEGTYRRGQRTVRMEKMIEGDLAPT